jgi:hypothetical protein
VPFYFSQTAKKLPAAGLHLPKLMVPLPHANAMAATANTSQD